MSPTERAYVARLKRRALAMSEETARRYLEAYRLIRDMLSESELARALESGNLDRLISELASDETLDPAVARLRRRLDQVLLDVAESEANTLPNRFRATFDILNPRVIEAARAFDGAAIQRLVGDVRETIRAIGAEKTILLSTHILQEVEAVADRVILIAEGRVQFDGTPADFRAGGDGDMDQAFYALSGTA